MRFYANNDKYILELIKDDNYIINKNGTIFTYIQLNGVKGNKLREVTYHKKDKYLRIYYKNKRVRLHRVIYAKFNGKLNNRLTIDHIDGNPKNNNPSNLQLLSFHKNLKKG